MDILRKLLRSDEIQITELSLKELADILQLRTLTAIATALAFLCYVGVSQKLVCLPLSECPFPHAMSLPNNSQGCRPIVSPSSCPRLRPPLRPLFK